MAEENKEEGKKFVLTEMEAALLHDLAAENEDVQLAIRVNRGNAALRVIENLREGFAKKE